MESSEDIAEGVVAMLNGLTTSIAFTAEVPLLVPVVDRMVDSATVQVYPFEETETPGDRADMFSATRVVQMLVQAPMSQTITRKTYLTWLNELKEGFRELVVSGWRFGGTETVSLYDFDAMKEKQQFMSLLKVTFFTFN